MAKKSKTVKGAGSSTIVANKKARFDYFIEDRFEAGLMLEGWEVKSLRAGKVQLVDSYVIIKNNEAWLLGALITRVYASMFGSPIVPRTGQNPPDDGTPEAANEQARPTATERQPDKTAPPSPS